MSKTVNKINDMRAAEPLIIRGAVVAAVTALIHVGVVMGVLPIDTDQESAIAGAIDLIGTAVLVVWARGIVVSPATSEESEEDAEAV